MKCRDTGSGSENIVVGFFDPLEELMVDAYENFKGRAAFRVDEWEEFFGGSVVRFGAVGDGLEELALISRGTGGGMVEKLLD